MIVDDGVNLITYPLDEPLIEFGFALEKKDLHKAMMILEPLELTFETEAQWQSLARISLEMRELLIAERC